MTIENSAIVDAVGLDKQTDEAVLSVFDHLEWADLRAHTALLAAKLNRYFGFVESGEVYEAYPEAHGRQLRIDLWCRFEPPESALPFLEKAEVTAREYCCAFTWRVHAA